MEITTIHEFLEEWRTIYTKPPPEGFKYNSIPELILQEGEYLSKEPYTKEEEEWLIELFRWIRTPVKTKSCYQTAFRLANLASYGYLNEVKHPEFIKEYGEGYGLTPDLFPIEHAVFVINNKPVDLVWRENRLKGNSTKTPKLFLKRAKWCLENNDYYVIKFPIKYVINYVFESKKYGVIEFNKEFIRKGKELWKVNEN